MRWHACFAVDFAEGIFQIRAGIQFDTEQLHKNRKQGHYYLTLLPKQYKIDMLFTNNEN